MVDLDQLNTGNYGCDTIGCKNESQTWVPVLQGSNQGGT